MREENVYGSSTGAWNNHNDPMFAKRQRIADELYEEIRNRKSEFEISAVAQNTGFSYGEVKRIYYHIFIRKHRFMEGDVRRFDACYYMAHSWMRLREGKNIQKHDLTMLKHELAEETIMGEGLEILYEDAHKIAQERYNYSKELNLYLKTHDV